MDLAIEYITGAGTTAVYARQRDYSGRYANFITGAWDIAESPSTTAYFTEPNPTNAPGFYSVSIPHISGIYPIEIIEASTGNKIYAGETTDPPPNLAAILAGITSDHGDGLYGAGTLSGAHLIGVTAVYPDTITPIPDVSIGLWNPAATFCMEQRTTDTNGVVVFHADDGDYILRARKGAFIFADQSVTVAGSDVAVGCLGTPFAVLPPTIQTLMVTAQLIDGTWAVGDIVRVTPAVSNQVVGGVPISSFYSTAIIDVDGIAKINGVAGIPISMGARVKVTVGSYYSRTVIIDNTYTKNITDYV